MSPPDVSLTFKGLQPESVAEGLKRNPGVVATETRRRGFNARGEAAGRSGLKEDRAMPVELCARLILRGLERRQREVVMSAQGRLGRWLKLVLPGVVENMALKALQDDVQPGEP